MAKEATDDEASYFLFKIQTKEWLLITYVPDSVSVCFIVNFW
jgi:hypothetical protein